MLNANVTPPALLGETACSASNRQTNGHIST